MYGCTRLKRYPFTLDKIEQEYAETCKQSKFEYTNLANVPFMASSSQSHPTILFHQHRTLPTSLLQAPTQSFFDLSLSLSHRLFRIVSLMSHRSSLTIRQTKMGFAMKESHAETIKCGAENFHSFILVLIYLNYFNEDQTTAVKSSVCQRGLIYNFENTSGRNLVKPQKSSKRHLYLR